MESCARFLPLQLKVAIYRPYLRSYFQYSLAGGAEDTSAVRESRATFMSTDDWIATRVYVAAAIKRVIVTGCVPLKAETVAGAGWKKNSFGFSQIKNEKSLKREIDLFQPNWLLYYFLR
ncbi:hypothetical protein K0M31_001886 [Melipona bicolor]|uniref:Uncharacterized protein n=1 Tax=Melipona bicolor TaxID=60889 RepID=A0AA40KY14_9HYME|nr:hypothetical protein K0M31_001886 [Melipona bicolor]